MPARRMQCLQQKFAHLQQVGTSHSPGDDGESSSSVHSKAPPPTALPPPLLAERLSSLEASLAAPQRIRAQRDEAHEALAAAAARSDAQDEQHAHTQHVLEQRQRDLLTIERRALREAEARLRRIAEERALTVHAAIAREKHEREDLEASLGAEIGELTAALHAERASRERALSALTAKSEQTVRALQGALARERRARQQQAVSTVALLDELLERLRAEVPPPSSARGGHTAAVVAPPLLQALDRGVRRVREHVASGGAAVGPLRGRRPLRQAFAGAASDELAVDVETASEGDGVW